MNIVEPRTSSFSFTGRVIQVVESLDYGDAVSNHVIALDRMLKETGLTSLIAVQWMHEKVSHRCFHLSQVEPSDRDVIIFHFSGHSEYAAPYVLGCNATRVLQYHNVTPQDFFPDSSDLHRFCRDGRRQLTEIIPRFHAHWGDSQYNLDELFVLGAPAKWAHVVPIVIPKSTDVSTVVKQAGSWLFVGRIAANKGQVKLVEAFTEAWRRDPASASRLDLVGGYDVNHEYYHELLHAVETSPARDRIFITGKVSDADRDAYLAQASLYVSFSEHEGFGVPLVEASLRATPVLALGRAAIPETMGGHGVADSANEVAAMAVRAIREPDFLAELLERQLKNAERFAWSAVLARLRNALADLLPRNDQYASVSIIVCTYNRRDMLERCLEYLALQTDPRFEVVVVDGPSTDGTGEMLRAWRHRVKLCKNPKAHLAISRNMGAHAAAGDILVYIDDDAIPFADYVGTVLSEFNGRPLTTAALGGPVYYAGALRFQAEDIAFNRLAEARMELTSKEIGRGEWKRSLIGTSTAFTRQHFDGVGGFDEQYDYFLDESDLTYRMQVDGNLVVYCPDLFLRHEFARSDNRKGKHGFNWFSIAKNTAYFVALYSGLEVEQRDDYLRRRFQQERIDPIDEGLRSGELDKETHRKLVDSIWSGMRQGLIDSRRGPLLPGVGDRPRNFLSFEVSHDVERVGIDVKRIHLCIIAKEFPPFSSAGGIGTLYYHLASELLLLGHEVTLITPDDEAGRYDQGRFHIRYAPWATGDFGSSAPSTRGNMLWSLSAARCMAEVHAERPVDIIECALWDTEGLAVALIEGRRPPVVLRLVTPFQIAATTNRWNVAPAIADQHIAAERAMIDHADAVVAISQSILESVTRHHEVVPSERWSVSHCGVAPWPFFDVDSNYDTMSGDVAMTDFMARNSKILLFVGRLERRKGVDTLLAAAARFLDADAEAGLMLAGRDVEEWARQYAGIVPERLRERVFFAGHVDDDLREKLLARAYCLIFPSRYESFGLVPLEAFVHGTPVVAANAGAVPEVVPDGVAGLLFDPESADDLAAKVLQLLRDDTLRKRLSEGARRQVHVLSARNSAVRAVNLYAALLASRRKAGL